MNTQPNKKLLVEQVRSGKQHCWRDFIKANFKTVANFMARVVQEPDKAGLLTTKTFSVALSRIGALAATNKSIQSWLLAQAKEVCFDELTTEEYTKTVFKRGLELFSSPPHLKSIPDKIIDSDLSMSAEFVDAIYYGLQPECELLLELVFLEEIPIPEVAELLGISDNLVNSFLFSILSALGDFSAFDHNDDCRPDLFLCIETINALGEPNELKRKITQAARCDSCTLVILRTVRLNELFSVDRRPNVAPDEAVLEDLSLNRKNKSAERKIATFVPIPVRVGSGHKPSITRTIFPALIIAIFILATLEVFNDNLITRLLPTSIRSTFSKTDHRIDRQNAIKLPRTIGHFYGATTARTPLLPCQQLISGMRSGLVAEYTKGHKATIDAKTCIHTFREKIMLLRGTVLLEIGRCEKVPFQFVTRDLKAELEDSKISSRTLPSKGTRLAVLAGQARVTLNDGTTLTIEQDQHILVGIDGKYEINDGIFQKNNGDGKNKQLPIPGSTDIIDRSLLKQTTVENILKERQTTKVQTDPQNEPVTVPFSGQNKYNTQTGYRNHF
jgi:DNA-directed RNA polymerase specialized sigma24 family protein